jgi:hypothetical protein
MSFTNLQQGTLITRDAYVALSELKKLVDSATEKIRVAERETVGVAIGRQQSDNDPLKTLRDAAEALQSPNFRSCGLADTREDANGRQLASSSARSISSLTLNRVTGGASAQQRTSPLASAS